MNFLVRCILAMVFGIYGGILAGAVILYGYYQSLTHDIHHKYLEFNCFTHERK